MAIVQYQGLIGLIQCRLTSEAVLVVFPVFTEVGFVASIELLDAMAGAANLIQSGEKRNPVRNAPLILRFSMGP